MGRFKSHLLMLIVAFLGLSVVQIQAGVVFGNLTGSYFSTSSYVFSGQLKAVAFTVTGGDQELKSLDMVLSSYSISDEVIITLAQYVGPDIPGPSIGLVGRVRVPAIPAQSPVLYTIPVENQIILRDNTSYWLVVTSPGAGFAGGAVWHATNPATAPTGFFTFIQYSFKNGFAAGWTNSLIFNGFSLNTGPVTSPDRAVFRDSRINRYDFAGAFVLYPAMYGDGSELGLHIYSGEGVLLLEVLPSMIAAVPEQPEVNTLIVEGGGVQLWRLSSGEFQAMGTMYNGKTYVVIFERIDALTEYRSYEETYGQ